MNKRQIEVEVDFDGTQTEANVLGKEWGIEIKVYPINDGQDCAVLVGETGMIQMFLEDCFGYSQEDLDWVI